MPRRDQDGEAGAARAGAEGSVNEELLNVTPLVSAYPQTKADRKTHRIDFAHFAKHPHRESYVRRYLPGELPVPVILAQPEGAPSHVAVAYVCPGERVRVFLWPGQDHTRARWNAERAAELHRVKLGMRGQA